MVQFFALFYLQNCFEAFVYSGSKGKLTFSDIIEIYSKTARVYEHSYENKNLETTYSALEKNNIIAFFIKFNLRKKAVAKVIICFRAY